MVTQSIKQTVPTNGMLMQKQTIFLGIDGSRSVNADLNIRSKSITNLKDPQSDECTHTVNVNFVDKTISDNNATIKTYYKKYVDGGLNHSNQVYDDVNMFQ